MGNSYIVCSFGVDELNLSETNVVNAAKVIKIRGTAKSFSRFFFSTYFKLPLCHNVKERYFLLFCYLSMPNMASICLSCASILASRAVRSS